MPRLQACPACKSTSVHPLSRKLQASSAFQKIEKRFRRQRLELKALHILLDEFIKSFSSHCIFTFLQKKQPLVYGSTGCKGIDILSIAWYLQTGVRVNPFPHAP